MFKCYINIFKDYKKIMIPQNKKRLHLKVCYRSTLNIIFWLRADEKNLRQGLEEKFEEISQKD